MSLFHAIYGNGGVTPEPGDTYGETQVLLWSNSNPNTSFDAQTVNIDLTNYDGVIIEFAESVNVSSVCSRVKTAKETLSNFGAGYLNTASSARARSIKKVDDNGVTFGTGGDTKENPSILIPLKIYGYRQYKKGSLSVDNEEIIVDANADKQLDAKSYYLVSAISASTKLVLTKGTIIGYIEQSHSSAHDTCAIIYTGDSGIVNSTGNSLHIKRIGVG